ncbi:hypothetical protein C8R47DRAFT_1086150 [Mycena vitilis]|nr:hypothetical protein C8R47DRAFT_1086150 [Mycena vitilis]
MSPDSPLLPLLHCCHCSFCRQGRSHRMNVVEDSTSLQRPSDNDRLIDALKSGFSDLIKKQEELQKAVESLKPQPSTDKKTTFWTTYMRVADEHDKEFKEKYSTDLDVALIFAGLFSAPQLAPDSPTTIVVVQGLLYASLFTTLLAALLAVLGKQWVMHYQAAGSRGTIEHRGLERQWKLDGLHRWKLDTVLQMFPLLVQLALLLFSSALSLYLWPIHRSIAGVVIGLTVLGFGSYILLLASAILFPDCPFQTPLAFFLKRVFLPPLRAFKITLEELRQKLRRLREHYTFSLPTLFNPRAWILPLFAQQASIDVDRPSWEEHPDLYSATSPSAEVPAILWLLATSTDPADIATAAELVASLQWPLDRPLASAMLGLRGALSSCFDITGVDQDSYHNHIAIPGKELIHRFLSCGKAYCTLRHINASMGLRPDVSADFWSQFQLSPQMEGPMVSDLSRLINILSGWPDVYQEATDTVDGWALYIVPSLKSLHLPEHTTVEYFLDQFSRSDKQHLSDSAFVDYLCCIIAFLGPLDPVVAVDVDKRQRRIALLLQLFKVLRTTTLDSSLVARIINITAQLAPRSREREELPYWMANPLVEISRFCSSFIGRESPQVFVSAATLARIISVDQLPTREFRIQLQTPDWIFSSLGFVQRQWEEQGNPNEWDSTTSTAVHGLLQFSAYAVPDSLPLQPPPNVVQLIVHALFVARGPVIPLLAFFTLCQAPQWFLNSDLQPILLSSSLWSQIGRVARTTPRFASGYFHLGEKLATTPEWKSIMRADLSAWVMVFIKAQDWNFVDKFVDKEAFISVLRSIWIDGSAELNQDTNTNVLDAENESWILSVVALSRAWDTLEPSLAVREYMCLARCTVSTSLRNGYILPCWERKPIPREIRGMFSAQLGQSLIHAASNAEHPLHNEISVGAETTAIMVDRMGQFLNVLGEKLRTELEPTDGEVVFEGISKPYADWEELQSHFNAELDALEGILGVADSQ